MKSECNIMVTIRSCRICLESRSKEYIILKVGNKWVQRFEYCFNLNLISEDLPFRLCNKCAIKLKKFCAFKEKCLSSQKLLKCLGVVKCKIKRINLEDKATTVSVEPNHNVDDLKNLNCDSDNTNDYNDIRNDSDYLDDSKEVLDQLKIEIDLSDCEDKALDNAKDIQTDGNLTCSRCLKSYTSNGWYVRHLKFCKSNDEFLENAIMSIKTESNIIPDTFENENRIEKRPSQPTELIPYLCGICQFSTENSGDLIKHLIEHWDNNDSQCLNCEFVAKDKAGLAAHRYKHQVSQNPRYLCHICHKKKCSEISLQFHYRRDHMNKPGGLCSQPNCNKEYSKYRLFKKHEIMHIHPGYMCDYCGKSYKYKHLIVDHINQHTNRTLNVCDICGKVSKSRRGLKVHIQNVHEDSVPVKCSHCNRMFKSLLHLRRHQRILAMAKTFKCEFCTSEYSLLSQLNMHLKSHSNLRPHCCHICGSSFKAKCHLVVHIRGHTGERPYKCNQCDKAFASGTQLKGHKMSHTRIFPCKCLYCEMTFRDKQRMSKHCVSKHKKILELIA